MKFTDIKSVDEMISFLKEKGKNHEYYYHYTSWDSLTKIFENKSFLLTRGNSSKINDQHEAIMKGSWDEWNKIFIGSFAFGSSEIMAMWGLYGLPWRNAVRLAIPKAQMNKWITSIDRIRLFENGQTKDYHGDFEAVLNDVVYVDGKNGDDRLQLSHYRKSITVSERYPLYGIARSDEMTGYIKNYAWQYENEVRLRIRLAHWTGVEKISIDIPDDVLNSIIVTTGPSFVWNDDDLLAKLYNENRIVESGFLGLVRYRELCDLCQHEHFIPRD